MIQKTKRPVSILLVLLMIVGMFSVLPISAGAEETWTFKLNSNFSGKWATEDIQSSVDKEITLSAGNYEFQIIANDGNQDYYRANSFSGSVDTYNQVLSEVKMVNCTFEATGGLYVLNYDGGTGNLTINKITAVAKVGTTMYSSLQAAIDAAQSGDTIELLRSIDVTERIVINKDITITSDGYKLRTTNAAADCMFIFGSKDHKLTIINTELDGNNLSENAIWTQANGGGSTQSAEVTLTDVTVQNFKGYTYVGAVYLFSNAVGNFNNCLFRNNATPSDSDDGLSGKDIWAGAKATVNINSGIIGDVYLHGGSASVTIDGNATVDTVKYGYTKAGEDSTQMKATVVSGTVGNVALGTGIQLAEENFVAASTADLTNAPAGYKWVDSAETGKKTLAPIPYVAKIGSTKYETLEEAFAAAVDGDTITLLADCAGNGIKAPQGKFATNGLTVDFAGFTYTVDGETVGSTGTETNGFQLLKDNKITFQNGTITSAKAKILVQNYSDLTLEGMTLTLNNPDYTEAYTLSNNNGNIVIDGTTINANPAGGFAFDVCRFSSYPSVNVKVTGESVINGDVEISASKSDAKDGFSLTLESGTMSGNIVLDQTAKNIIAATPDKAVITKAAAFDKAAPADYKWDANGVLVPVKYVAQIGNTKYETLADAFAAAVDGNTITLLADCAGNGIKVTPAGKFANGLTVDFAGFTYTVDGETVGSTGTETNGFQLLKNNKVTFKNGTITSAKAKILVQNYSDLTLEGMTLTLNNPDYTEAYTLSNNNGNIVIDGTTINANPAGGFAFDVCRFSSYPSVNVTVKGESEINGNVEISASGSDAKDGFSLTLESGTMTGNIVLDQTAKNVIAATPEKAVISKEATFDKAAPADYKWDANGVLVPVDYVAQIGSTKYETLEAAFAAAQDGDTITLLADCAGNGIKAPQGKFATGLTVDFAGHTYTVSGTPVGSTGTETIGFQLLKDNKITFKNGTITGDSRITRGNTYLLRMIQNYSDLTLDNMTVSMVGQYYDQITVSTCNGKTVIKDSKISAPDYTWANITDPAAVRAAALTVGTFSSYPSIDVTVEGTSVINGDVNVSDDNNKKAFSLKLNGGELNGKINLDENAKAAIDDTTSTANVTKADTFTQAAPEGYAWKDNGNGTASLAKIVDLFAGYGLTLHGDIGLIFYLDPAAVGVNAADVSSVSVSFTCDKYTGTVTDFTREGNYIKVAYYVPAAYMASPVHAYAVSINGISSEETDDYSVQEYAQRIIADPVACGIPAAKANAAKNLMKEMLNYGSKAQVVFASQMQNPISQYAPIADYTMPDVTADMIEHAIHGTATDMSTVHPEADAVFYTPSVIYLSKTTLRMYFEIPTGNGSKNPDAYDGSQSDWYYWVDVTNIPAAELDDQQDFEVNGVPFHYSVLDYAKTVVAGNTAQVSKDLASALYLYNQAANAYYA